MLKGSKGTQLQMFDTASNITKRLLGGEVGSMESGAAEGLWGKEGDSQQTRDLAMMHGKMREAKKPHADGSHGAGVYDSIGQHGFQGHITMGHGMGPKPLIGEGHHRLAAATSLEQQEPREGVPQSGRTQWVGLDHLEIGPHEFFTNEAKYEQSYPQNVSDLEWSAGKTLDDKKK